MDNGKSNQDDANLVQRNQQINTDNTLDTHPDSTLSQPKPFVPYVPKGPASQIPTTPQAPPPPPMSPSPINTTPKLPESRIPFDHSDDENKTMGIGTPNIGIEDKPIPPSVNSDPASNRETPEITIQEPPKIESTPIKTVNSSVPTIDADDSASIPNGFQVKNYQNSQDDPRDKPQPPVKASTTSASLVAMIIVALVIGSSGGFLGFKYWDNLKSHAATTSTPTPKESATPNVDVSTWKTYTSTTYNFSLKYPDSWAVETTDPQADSLVFASNKESINSAPTGYKIEMAFQSNNGLTLKAWVDANTTALGETTKPSTITVSGQTAYQQELLKNGHKVSTFIERPDKIMIVTYSAPSQDFGSGGEWYNNLINSIKFN